MKFLCYGVVV